MARRRRMRRRGALAACAVAAGALVLGVAAVELDLVRLRISWLWPLHLSEPGGWLVDRQLRDLRDDPGLCRRTLQAPAIVANPVADQAPRPGCGWQNAVRIERAGGARLEVSAASCELAAALALWLEHVVQPAARRHLGQGVAGIEHLGAYACRNIRGSPAFADRPSQHTRANALDVRGFQLADGRRLRIATDWGRDSAEGRFLAAVQKGACAYFRVAVGPAYNAAHRDHFHLDRGPWRACR